MKILTGQQIREADRATIAAEGITSLDLMERAATRIARWIERNVDPRHRLLICCGKGGNGGDGLAVARILTGSGRDCEVFLAVGSTGKIPVVAGLSEEILDPNRPTTAELSTELTAKLPTAELTTELVAETKANLARLPQQVTVRDISVERPDIEPDAIIIDAILGVGVIGEVREPLRSIIEWINSLPNRVISIDIPSGMPTEWRSVASTATTVTTSPITPTTPTAPATATPTIVQAGTTLAIEFPKLATLLPELGKYAGNVVVIPIELNTKFLAATATPYYYITKECVDKMRLPRTKFSHKGDYGHALLVAGSTTMPGAAILATGGALRSGCGLVTVHIPEKERFALTSNHPSAMLSLDPGDCFTTLPATTGHITPPETPETPETLERFSAIGVGPGLGNDPKTKIALKNLMIRVMEARKATGKIKSKEPGESEYLKEPDRPTSEYPKEDPKKSNGPEESSRPTPKITMVLDADALNIIAETPELKNLIPPCSILTPHPGELRRLTGDWRTDREKLDNVRELARETQSVVIVKGAHSVICTPDGRFLFNSTGTPGMAKAGSGDVLTGLITGLAARGYDAETASIMGVYTHGRAGERAARHRGLEAMNASDLADFL
jgi:NAD(P)H-hydrate epimerase